MATPIEIGDDGYQIPDVREEVTPDGTVVIGYTPDGVTVQTGVEEPPFVVIILPED